MNERLNDYLPAYFSPISHLRRVLWYFESETANKADKFKAFSTFSYRWLHEVLPTAVVAQVANDKIILLFIEILFASTPNVSAWRARIGSALLRSGHPASSSCTIIHVIQHYLAIRLMTFHQSYPVPSEILD